MAAVSPRVLSSSRVARAAGDGLRLVTHPGSRFINGVDHGLGTRLNVLDLDTRSAAAKCPRTDQKRAVETHHPTFRRALAVDSERGDSSSLGMCRYSSVIYLRLYDDAYAEIVSQAQPGLDRPGHALI